MEGAKLQRLRLRDNLTGQGLILATLGLLAVGIIMIYSTYGAVRPAANWYERSDSKEAIFAAAAVLIMVLVGRADYHFLAKSPWPNNRLLKHCTPATFLLFLGLAASAILLVPGVGHAVNGRVRWIKIGPVTCQPPDLLKLALMIWLAVYLSRPWRKIKSFWRTFVPGMLVIGVSVVLVVTQNFSNAALIGMAAAALLVMAGVRWWYLLLLLPLVAFAFHHEVRHDPARWARITSFVHPYDVSDPNAYQSRQSLIAIGTGVDPAGLGGSMSKRGFLPECGNDFVFAVICEEMGWRGAALVIGLFVTWLMLARWAALRACDTLGALLACGLGFAITLQAVLHIAVNLGLFPTTGQPLPFVSAGGTSLITNAAAVGLLISVSSRRGAKETANIQTSPATA